MNRGASHWRGSFILFDFFYISIAIIAIMWYNIEKQTRRKPYEIKTRIDYYYDRMYIENSFT